MRTPEPIVWTVLLTLAIASDTGTAASEPPGTSERPLSMSQGLLELFRAEMRELVAGTQAMVVAIPAADWSTIISVSRQMQASYVLEKELTEEQQSELAELPQRFKELDRSFHARTGKLAEAAMARDSEAVAYQFSRLLETCAACHTSFAQARFPNFAAPPEQQHGH